MNSAQRALIFGLFLIALGIWGCGKSTKTPRTSTRLRNLQIRNVRLEKDYQAAIVECAKLRQRLAVSQKQYHDLRQQKDHHKQQIKQVSQQRDDYKGKLSVAVGQRDNLQTQLASFSKDLHNLALKVEQVARQDNRRLPATTVSRTVSK